MATGLPRVTIQPTRDLSFRVPPRGGNGVAAILVNARKGPIEEPVYVGSESEYLRVFCPDETISVSDDEAHHSAIAFLSEGAGLYAVRPLRTGAAHASIKVGSSGGNLGSGIENSSATSGLQHISSTVNPTEPSPGYDIPDSKEGDVMTVLAKTAGEWGNNISVEFEDTDDPNLDLPTLTTAKEIPTNLYRFSLSITTGSPAKTIANRFPLGTAVRVAQGELTNPLAEATSASNVTSNQYYYDSNTGAFTYYVSASGSISLDILATATISGTTTTLQYNTVGDTAQEFNVPTGLTVSSVAYTEDGSTTSSELNPDTTPTAGEYNQSGSVLTVHPAASSANGTIAVVTSGSATTEVTSAVLNALDEDSSAGLGLDLPTGTVIEDIDRIALSGIAVDLTMKSINDITPGTNTINFPTGMGTLDGTEGIIGNVLTRNAEQIGPTLRFNLETSRTLAGATIYVKYRANADKARARTLVVRYEGPDDGEPMEVERFIVSPYQNLRDGYGRSAFGEDSTAASRYIIVHMKPSNFTLPPITNTATRDVPVLQRSLTQGTDGTGTAPTGAGKMSGEVEGALEDTNNIQFSYLLDGGEEGLHDKLQSIAAARRDCLAVLSATGGAGRDQGVPSTATTASDLKGGLNQNSSFSAMYSPYVEIHDKFNDRALFVPPDGYAGAIMARTVRRYKPWTAPAGQNYARLDNIRGLAHRYSESQAGNLYDRNINPIIFKPGQGFVIYGQKTTQTRASALDRINVRFLLNEVLTNVKGFLDGYLFTENDIATRASILTQVNGYMDRVRAGRGVTAYQTVCDETNNTPEDIDSNTLNVAIVMQPTRATEYINLLGVLTRTGATFTETLAQ